MEFNRNNLISLITGNNGLEEPIELEILKMYFGPIKKKEIKKFGKIKRKKFLPNKTIWEAVINLIIKEQKEYYLNVLDANEYNYEIYVDNDLGKVEFESYLSKKDLKKIIDNKNFKIKKSGTTVTLYFTKIAEELNRLYIKENELVNLISTLSKTTEDQLKNVIINNRNIASQLMSFNLVTHEADNSYIINDDILKRILNKRLENCECSLDNKIMDKLKEQNICVIHTPLKEEYVNSLTNEIEEKYDIIRISKKANIRKEDFVQLVLRKK